MQPRRANEASLKKSHNPLNDSSCFYRTSALNPTPPTCVDLFEGATGPDVVQRSGSLWGAGADVRKDGRREEGTQFFFPQALHLRAVGSHAKVSQHQQLSLTYNTNT